MSLVDQGPGTHAFRRATSGGSQLQDVLNVARGGGGRRLSGGYGGRYKGGEGSRRASNASETVHLDPVGGQGNEQNGTGGLCDKAVNGTLGHVEHVPNLEALMLSIKASIDSQLSSLRQHIDESLQTHQV